VRQVDDALRVLAQRVPLLATATPTNSREEHVRLELRVRQRSPIEATFTDPAFSLPRVALVDLATPSYSASSALFRF